MTERYFVNCNNIKPWPLYVLLHPAPFISKPYGSGVVYLMYSERVWLFICVEEGGYLGVCAHCAMSS